MDTPSMPGPAAAYQLNRLDLDLTSFKNKIDAARNADGSSAPDELRDVTQQFEALFVGYMLKVMRSTVNAEDAENSSLGKDIYTEMFDNEIASNISRTHSLGISDLLYRQLEQLQHEREKNKSVAPAEALPQNEPTPMLTAPEAHVDQAKPVSVTSPYGMRNDPFDGVPRFHGGVDLAAPAGMPFKAVDGGTVVHAGPLGTYGNTIIVEHPNGDRTLYAHASSILVRTGDSLGAEQVIGTVGRSGRATGPHLHFEVRRQGQNIDPNPFLANRSPFFTDKS
jgi:murein DD-endopeptidase MepM/ murein hydrolase activator NlpD